MADSSIPEQTALTKEQYQSSYIDYGSQYYGIFPEGQWTGINVDADTEIKYYGDSGSEETRPNIFDKSLSGDPMVDVSIGLPSTLPEYTNYADFKAANNIKKDRTPFDFSTENLFGTAVGLAGGLPGKFVGSLIMGDTITNAFGNNTVRPSGPLGWITDKVIEMQYNDIAQIQAAVTAGSATTGFSMQIGNGGITRKPGTSTYTGNMYGMSYQDVARFDALSKGFVPSSYDVAKETGKTFKDAGWMPVGYMTNGDGVTAGLPTGFYTESGKFYNSVTGETSYYGLDEHATGLANTHGLTRAEIDAALREARSGSKTLSEAIQGIKESKSNWNVTAGGPGYTPGTVDIDGDGTGIETDTPFTGISSYNPNLNFNYFNTYEDDDTSTPEPSETTPSTPSTPSGPETVSASMPDYANDMTDALDPGFGDNDGDNDDSGTTGAGEDGWGGGFGGGYSDWARGGLVGYAMGTPPAGVQAAQSGFIDAPPSQVSEEAKVADNRPDSVPKGTYILNAAAVEFAGEQDIRKMIMDAQKEAIRRGLSTEDFERHSDLIDIAVSSGEVKIAPHLVKIIGEDRLEKINKRGIRKTEQRIAQNGQQPVQAAQGGFLA